jgi:hypothetical protein
LRRQRGGSGGSLPACLPACLPLHCLPACLPGHCLPACLATACLPACLATACLPHSPTCTAPRGSRARAGRRTSPPAHTPPRTRSSAAPEPRPAVRRPAPPRPAPGSAGASGRRCVRRGPLGASWGWGGGRGRREAALAGAGLRAALRLTGAHPSGTVGARSRPGGCRGPWGCWTGAAPGPPGGRPPCRLACSPPSARPRHAPRPPASRGAFAGRWGARRARCGEGERGGRGARSWFARCPQASKGRRAVRAGGLGPLNPDTALPRAAATPVPRVQSH